MASERKECSIENYFMKKNRLQVQESVVAVAMNTSGPGYGASGVPYGDKIAGFS